MGNDPGGGASGISWFVPELVGSLFGTIHGGFQPNLEPLFSDGGKHVIAMANAIGTDLSDTIVCPRW
jgi:hypothetical protein